MSVRTRRGWEGFENLHRPETARKDMKMKLDELRQGCDFLQQLQRELIGTLLDRKDFFLKNGTGKEYVKGYLQAVQDILPDSGMVETDEYIDMIFTE